MAAYLKYSLLLLMCCSAWRGYANEIGRLKTKEDVRKFIAANLGGKGFYFGRCSEPVSIEKVLKEIKHDTSFYDPDSGGRFTKSSISVVEWALDNTDWHFYKADIDGNGYTDMVIDAGMVIVIMDMGDNIEGQLVSISDNLNLYGFKQFISLPDGTPALVLRHDHNPARSRAHSDQQGKVSYITDALAGNKTTARSIKTDTLYKITAGADSIKRLTGTWPDMKQETVYNGEYADTVDMRLYNMTDTIVYKSNGFMVYKPGFKPAGISKIGYYYQDYGTVSGWVSSASCLEINKNGKCYLKYQAHESGTTFFAMLDSARLSKLWGFMSAIDTKPINGCSDVAIDGGDGAIFAFYFDDGTVKKMSFWNCPIPMDLRYLGKAISDISEVLNWQLSEKN